MSRSAHLIRAIELGSANFLGLELYTDREKGPDAWYRRGTIDSVTHDQAFGTITIGVDQRDFIHMDAGREILLLEKPST